MDNIDKKIELIYHKKILQMLVTDYIETENNELKKELYEKIKELLVQLNL